MPEITVALPERSDDEARKMWAEYEEGIDARLNAARPGRSGPKDRSWMEEAGVLGWARNHLPYEEYAVRNFAEAIVMRREGFANRKANRLMRRYALGQAPLFWGDLGPLPFTIDHERLRVRFDAATPADFRTHATYIRETAEKRREAEFLVASALEELADLATAAGFSRVAQIGDLPQKGQIAA